MSETDASSRPIPLRDAAELDSLLEEHRVVLLELYTDGCGICASMEPVLTNVARTTEAVVATVNPRDDPALIERFDVRRVPKFVCFVDGELVAERDDGFVPHDDLVAWLESSIG